MMDRIHYIKKKKIACLDFSWV